MGDGITSQMLLYADDAKIYRSVTALGEDEELQNDLNVISKWADGSLMKFNMTKCHTLTLTGRVKLAERNYILDGNKYLNVQTEKDLGVIVDSRLLFREHIAKKTRLANCMVAIIRKSFIYLNAEVLTTLYKALVRTSLEYANQCSNYILDGNKTKQQQDFYRKQQQDFKVVVENVTRWNSLLCMLERFLSVKTELLAVFPNELDEYDWTRLSNIISRDIDSNPSIRPEYRVFGTSKPNPNIKILKSEYRIRIFFFLPNTE